MRDRQRLVRLLGFCSSPSPFLSGGMATSILGATRFVPEACFVEGDLLAEHVIDGPRQLSGQDAQRLGRSAFLRLLLLPAAGPFALPQKQTCRLREGPTQVR